MKKRGKLIILPSVFLPVSLDLYGLGFGSKLTVGSLTPRRKSSVGLGTTTRTRRNSSGFGFLNNTYLGSQYLYRIDSKTLGRL